MKINFLRQLLLFIGAFALISAFNNCGGFKVSEQASTSPNTVLTLPPGVLADQTGDTIKTKVLTADQMLRSLGQLTKVDPATASIKAEYDLRKNVLADSFNLSAVNPPLLIGVANLASTFCDRAITIESAQMASARRLFGVIDFTMGLTNLSDANYQTLTSNLAMKFWGRDATVNEKAILTLSRKDYEDNLSGSHDTAAATRGLALYTCTGMLASFESVTF